MKDFVEWAKKNAHPIKSLTDYDVQDFVFLKDAVGDARLLSFGESQHYTREFNSFQSILFKYLVEEMGFTAFAYETPFAESRLVYDYVLGADITLDEVFIKGVSPLFGGWEEIRSMVQWMREYNQNNTDRPKLHFYGVDIGSCAYGGNGAYPVIEAVLNYMKAIDEQYAETFDDILLIAKEYDLFNFNTLPKEAREHFIAEVIRMRSRIETMAPYYVKLSGEEAYRWACQSAAIAVYSANWFSIYAESGSAVLADNVRERCMADNLMWVLDQEGLNGKVVYHSHNEHVRKDLRCEGYIQTGAYLQSMLDKEEMITIAGTNKFSFRQDDHGSEESLQYALGQVDLPYFVLNFRDIPKDSIALNWLNRTMKDRLNTGYTYNNPYRSYDMVFFVGEQLNLSNMKYCPYTDDIISLDPAVYKNYTGIYKLERSWLPTPVEDYITIEQHGDKLFSHGLYGPDGRPCLTSTTAEHFPVRQSELFSISETKFLWKDYFGYLEFLKDEEGRINKLMFVYYYLGGENITAVRVKE